MSGGSLRAPGVQRPDPERALCVCSHDLGDHDICPGDPCDIFDCTCKGFRAAYPSDGEGR